MAESSFPLLVAEVAEQRPGSARNVGVQHSRAPLVLFLDDDVECFQDIAAATLDLMRGPGIDAVGGANLTPPASSALERVTGYALASWAGAGAMRERYRVRPEGPSDEHGLILCNLAVRKEAFVRQKGFRARLISNEENVLLQSLQLEGARLWSSPRLAVYHRRRGTWTDLGRQATKYGAGRAQNILLLPRSTRWFYFLPAAFVAYLISLPAWLALAGPVAGLPCLFYGCLLGLGSVGSLYRHRDPAAVMLPAVCLWIHLAYGLGFTRAAFFWAPRRALLVEH